MCEEQSLESVLKSSPTKNRLSLALDNVLSQIDQAIVPTAS